MLQIKRILHIAPLVEPITKCPPGGEEQAVVNLAAFQSASGCEVSVIAVSGSSFHQQIKFIDLKINAGEVVPVNTSSTNSFTPEKITLILQQEAKVFKKVQKFISEHSGQFDVIHNHCYDFFPLFCLNDLQVPIVHTLSLPPIIPWISAALAKQSARQNVKYCTVSEAVAAEYKKHTGFLPEVILNGIELEQINFSANPQKQLLWAGRISGEKGLHRAIDLAIENKTKLVVLGRIYDQNYFDREIAHKLKNKLIEYRGFVAHEAVLQEMGLAQALLFPIEWAEPFGLVLVEALASGTPVIAFNRGAVAEIVVDQKNGYLCESQQQMSEAIKKISLIDRRVCRDSVVGKFCIEKMALNYDRVYSTVI